MIAVGLIGLGMAVKPHMQAIRELEAAGRVTFAGGFSPSNNARSGLHVQRLIEAWLNDAASDP